LNNLSPPSRIVKVINPEWIHHPERVRDARTSLLRRRSSRCAYLSRLDFDARFCNLSARHIGHESLKACRQLRRPVMVIDVNHHTATLNTQGAIPHDLPAVGDRACADLVCDQSKLKFVTKAKRVVEGSLNMTARKYVNTLDA
jgi:hypothetical protein